MANKSDLDLAAFARAVRLSPLPALPRAGRAPKPQHPCACGCGRLTRGTWYPGDDGRSVGWAIRVERGMLTVDEIPEAHGRAGAVIMLKRRAAEVRKVG